MHTLWLPGTIVTQLADSQCRPVESFKALSRNKAHPEVQADGPLCVLHGTDSWDSIGLPHGSKAAASGSACVDAWAAAVRAAFPEPQQQAETSAQLSQLPSDAGVFTCLLLVAARV